jgi:hypothetical protein
MFHFTWIFEYIPINPKRRTKSIPSPPHVQTCLIYEFISGSYAEPFKTNDSCWIEHLVAVEESAGGGSKISTEISFQCLLHVSGLLMNKHSQQVKSKVP